LIEHVKSGELRIDSAGRIWRDMVRKGLKNGGSSLYKIKARRAERSLPMGYLQVRVMLNGKRVYGCAHRLIWQFFNGDIPDGYTINHKNGKKDDNRPENLEVCTYSENMKHAFKTGLKSQDGKKNPNCKLSNKDVLEIRTIYSNGGITQEKMGKKFKVSFQTISRIVRGKERKKQDGITSDYSQRRQLNKSRDFITGRFVSKKKAGRLLDGKEWNQYPETGGYK